MGLLETNKIHFAFQDGREPLWSDINGLDLECFSRAHVLKPLSVPCNAHVRQGGPRCGVEVALTSANGDIGTRETLRHTTALVNASGRSVEPSLWLAGGAGFADLPGTQT